MHCIFVSLPGGPDEVCVAYIKCRKHFLQKRLNEQTQTDPTDPAVETLATIFNQKFC